MMRVLLILVLTCAAMPTASRADSIKVNPRATYLMTGAEEPRNRIAIDLSTLSFNVGPGTLLKLEQVGDYSRFDGDSDVHTLMIGVFSQGDTISDRFNDPNDPHRLPGAIDAGADVITPPTFFFDFPTDIPEDFLISGADFSSITIQVPTDATHLFLSTLDHFGSTFFEDNRDPDNDFGIEITPGLPDSDDDGLTDDVEVTLGTDPLDPDTDDDLLLDGTEVVMADGTGCPNPLDSDSDDDGLLDGEEVVLGTSPCNPDTDGDCVPDDIDPSPTDPGVSSGWIEDQLRQLAADIDSMSVDVFSGKNDNAAAGRRNAMSNKVTAAANSIAADDSESALDQLLSLFEKVDGEDPPPDWMFDGSPEKDFVAAEVEFFICLLLP